MFRKMDSRSVFWTALLTILFTTKALKVSKGGIHGKAVMVGKSMTVYPLQSAVTGMAESLNDILVGHSCSMEGGGHMVAIVVETGMRKAVLTEEPIVPGRKGIGVEVADVALLADEVDDVIREFHKTITFVCFRHLLNYPLIFVVDDHVCMNMHSIHSEVIGPFQSTDFTSTEPTNGG